ncbi:biliverdin-producing heme oxygenase [Lentzea albida]|uniref:Heme oxygenase n=1 Tax=Lentzea albida TaxID=65499 RepID=A0A1H9MIV1_9PSEU|nr:biliverdin-producing heme oxygenase [Lentzea albida]SER23481.1 Heme oxygenase [Lentzea albida]
MTLLTRLRTDTRTAHQALEDDLAFLSGLTPARYSEVLAAFLGFHEPLEKALTASAAAHRLPWDLAPDTERLTSDLRGLGWSPSRIASLPRASPPDVEALPALVGSLYVVEGARLGGQLITRWVGQALGPVPVSFFASDGDARRRFRRFGALAGAVVPDEEADVAVAAANAHFGLFREWLGSALLDRNG